MVMRLVMPELLTITEYAKRRGVSQPAVTKAIKAGRITVVESDGKKLIDPDVADIQWAKNTRAKASNIEHVYGCEVGAEGDGIEADVYDIKAARAKREYHEANIAEMRERKEASELVEANAVNKAAIDAGAMLRHALESLPGKLSATLAAVDDAEEIRESLTREVDAILQDLAANLERVPGVGD